MTEEIEQQDAELTNIEDGSLAASGTEAQAELSQENSAPAETQDAAEQENPPFEWPQDITVESVIEAILFASDEPLSIDRLVNIAQFNGGAKQIRKCIETLNQQYVETKRSFRIEEIAGGFR
jgi:segregation and condensation protein B